MSNVQYAKSHMDGFLSALTKACGFLHVIGAYEFERMHSAKAPVIWRHPEDRPIITFEGLTDHREDTENIGEAGETFEIVIIRPDYEAARVTLCNIWAALWSLGQKHDGIPWFTSVSFGTVRLPRKGEELMGRGVPTGSFTMIALITIAWLVPRAIIATETAESASVAAEMQDDNTIVGTTTIPEVP